MALGGVEMGITMATEQPSATGMTITLAASPERKPLTSAHRNPESWGWVGGRLVRMVCSRVVQIHHEPS